MSWPVASSVVSAAVLGLSLLDGAYGPAPRPVVMPWELDWRHGGVPPEPVPKPEGCPAGQMPLKAMVPPGARLVALDSAATVRAIARYATTEPRGFVVSAQSTMATAVVPDAAHLLFPVGVLFHDGRGCVTNWLILPRDALMSLVGVEG